MLPAHRRSGRWGTAGGASSERVEPGVHRSPGPQLANSSQSTRLLALVHGWVRDYLVTLRRGGPQACDVCACCSHTICSSSHKRVRTSCCPTCFLCSFSLPGTQGLPRRPAWAPSRVHLPGFSEAASAQVGSGVSIPGAAGLRGLQQQKSTTLQFWKPRSQGVGRPGSSWGEQPHRASCWLLPVLAALALLGSQVPCSGSCPVTCSLLPIVSGVMFPPKLETTAPMGTQVQRLPSRPGHRFQGDLSFMGIPFRMGEGGVAGVAREEAPTPQDRSLGGLWLGLRQHHVIPTNRLSPLG